MVLEYRAALPGDVAECLDVRGRTRENAISAEGLRARGIALQSWAEDVRQGALPGHVCLADGKIIGFCFGVRESGEVAVLALLPAFENQGIGRSLLNRVAQELKTFGFNRLFLGCSPDRSMRSYGFYRHLGWHTTGTFDAAGDEVLEYFLEEHEPVKADAKLIPDAITEEIKKFQGTWKQIACEKDGVADPVDELGWKPKSTFTDDTFVVTLADGSIAIKGTFKLDPTREPKTIDWTDTFGEDAGKTFLAIYSLESDQLIFCAADEGQERPTEFRTRLGHVLRVCQRETP